MEENEIKEYNRYELELKEIHGDLGELSAEHTERMLDTDEIDSVLTFGSLYTERVLFTDTEYEYNENKVIEILDSLKNSGVIESYQDTGPVCGYFDDNGFIETDEYGNEAD
jgi:hypothetical protein